jgi:hypothetical protein
MKVKNISSSRIYLQDLSPVERRGETQYLSPGQSVYLPNTSEVVRSAIHGTIRGLEERGLVELEDVVALDATGGSDDSVTLTHGFGLPPQVMVLKQVGGTWVDGTGTVDIVHSGDFMSVSIANTTPFPLTFYIRLL